MSFFFFSLLKKKMKLLRVYIITIPKKHWVPTMFMVVGTIHYVGYISECISNTQGGGTFFFSQIKRACSKEKIAREGFR